MKYLRNKLAQFKQWILSIVNTRLSFKEIGELADKWLKDEIAKDLEDRFTDNEKYWMIEGYIEGYKKAQNGC